MCSLGEKKKTYFITALVPILKIVQQKNNSQTYTVSASQGKIFTIEFFCRFATHFLHLTPPCALLGKKKTYFITALVPITSLRK
jgi:hypothetical protein